MKEQWVQVGRCRLCGAKIVRIYLFRGDTGRTISPICSCSPHREEMGRLIDVTGVFVVEDEKDFGA